METGDTNAKPQRFAPEDLDQLHEMLEAAARSYEAEPLNQRQAVCDAMEAVTQFLSGQGFAPHVLTPLNRPVVAIVDLCHNNRPDPLFAQKLRKTKSRRGLDSAMTQGKLAALAEGWLKVLEGTQLSKDQKLNQAARELSGRYFGSLTAKQVKSALAYRHQGPDYGHHEIMKRAYEDMKVALDIGMERKGGCVDAQHIALAVQVEVLNKAGRPA